MKDRQDRKPREVAVAQYRYRHEADFAAGFLREAGIPYRLQVDDAGGAGLGLSALRPSVLWVRAIDVERARAVLAHEVLEEPDTPEWLQETGRAPWDEDEWTEVAAPPPHPLVAAEGTRADQRSPRPTTLGTAERAVALLLAVLGVPLAELLPGALPWLLRVALPAAIAFLLLAAAVLGRAPASLAHFLRGLTGNVPRASRTK